jgi:lysophospholipase L1-like esterase
MSRTNFVRTSIASAPTHSAADKTTHALRTAFMPSPRRTLSNILRDVHAVANAPHVEKLRRREQVTIVFIGDSNTAPHVPHARACSTSSGWLSAACSSRYANTRSRVINAAQSGEGVNGCSSRLDDDVIRFRPDLVIVGYGMTSYSNGEEYLQRGYIEPMRSSSAACATTAGAEIILRTSNPIICVNRPKPPAARVPGREYPNDTLGIYSRALVELARELNCPVVDHYRMWLDQTYPPTDGVNDPNGLWLRMSD